MRRREFITLFAGMAALGLRAAHAQQKSGLHKLAILTPFVEGDAEGKSALDVFRQQLRDLGWSEGNNLHIDERWSGGNAEQARAYAAELVRLSPDVIFAYFNAQLAALSRETQSIPIVFVGASDPVGAGYVASLARPGGNITGFTLYEASLAGKWLGFLKELVPGLARAALMINPDTAVLHGTLYSNALAAAAKDFNVEPIVATVHTTADIEAVIRSLGSQAGGGLIVAPDTFTETNGELVVSLAAQYRVPAVYAINRFAKTGALVTYGPDIHEAIRRAAGYIDRVLRGERPAILPVQAPTKFQTIVNLKTAQALGLSVPPGILVAADEVIE